MSSSSTRWDERYGERYVTAASIKGAHAREILATTPPVARLDRRLWVFRRTASGYRYDLLGFSREALFWQDQDQSTIEVNAPDVQWCERLVCSARGVRDALLVIVEAMLQCDATCITHEDCFEEALKGSPELGLRCARGQLHRIALSLPYGKQLKTVPLVREDRRKRCMLHKEVMPGDEEPDPHPKSKELFAGAASPPEARP